MAYELNGTQYPSVTTIQGVLDKPALMYWSANCAVDYIKENVERIQNPDGPHVVDGILNDARGAFRNVSKAALDTGTMVHNAIEAYIKHGRDLVGDLPDSVQNGFLAFLDWEQKNKVTWLASELQLFNTKIGYAGTCDAILEMNGNIYLVDFKTSKAIYDEYRDQIAAYLMAYRTSDQPEATTEVFKRVGDITNLGILRLDKETGAPEFVDTTFGMGERMRAFTSLVDYYYVAKKRRLKGNPFVQKYWEKGA